MSQSLRIKLRNGLRRERHNKLEQVNEYIVEAEAHTGPEYWDQFDDLEQVIDDFDLYLLTIESIDK